MSKVIKVKALPKGGMKTIPLCPKAERSELELLMQMWTAAPNVRHLPLDRISHKDGILYASACKRFKQPWLDLAEMFSDTLSLIRDPSFASYSVENGRWELHPEMTVSGAPNQPYVAPELSTIVVRFGDK